MRASGQQYKMADGSLQVLTCAGAEVEEIAKGATLWNGYDYTTQEWVTDGAVREGVDIDETPGAVLVSSHQEPMPVSPLHVWLAALGAHFVAVS